MDKGALLRRRNSQCRVLSEMARQSCQPAPSENAFPSYFPDWFPTLAQVAGAKIPEGLSLDGMDLRSALTKPNEHLSREGLMFWEFAGYRGQIAVRDGKWKAVRQGVRSKNPKSWELYDLDADRAESNNLAEKHPDIVAKLEAAYVEERIPEPDFALPLYDKKS